MTPIPEDDKNQLDGAKSVTVTEEKYTDTFTPEVNSYHVQPFSPEQENEASGSQAHAHKQALQNMDNTLTESGVNTIVCT